MSAPDWTIGVEIVTAGMQWPASTGDVTVTVEHIADAIRAANDDPHIQVPRNKLGHTSAVNGGHEDWNPFAALGDAEPSFGRYVNLRADNDGAVLVGDLVDVPQWLLDCAPASFPNRSMECAWDVQTAGGKRYSMVITAVAMLGVHLPAVQDLEDLTAFMATGPDAKTLKEGQMPTAASVSTDIVWHRFNFDWVASEAIDGVDTYWWWARDIRVDPDEVIADDDEGNLWRVPFSTDGEDKVTFGTPTRVRETYVDVPPAAAAARDAARTVASFSRPKKDPPTAASERPNTQEASTVMDVDTTLLRRRLGLAEDASEEDITAALAAEPETPETPEPETPEGEVETPEVKETPPDPIAEQSQRELAAATARVAALEAEASQRKETEAKARRDSFATTWVKEGRIAPSERDHYRGLLEIDEKRTVELAASLAAGRIPVDERGTASTEDDDTITSTGWHPSLQEA